MAEIWFRGESTTVAPAQPGAYVHDFGDGVYFTDSVTVAREYASLRVSEGGGQPRVLALNVERNQLGKILDLNADQRWNKYIKTPLIPKGLSPEMIIKTAGNENYSKFFSAFLLEQGIQLSEYTAVIGPEFVRGGNQLCILQPGGRPTALALQLRQALRPVPRVITPGMLQVVHVPASDLLKAKSPVRRIAGNQDAVAAFGIMLASALHGLGEYGISQKIQRDIDTRLAGDIAGILSRGSGVLVIAAICESIVPDFNGFKTRMFLTSYLRAGITSTDALARWLNESKLTQGPPPGFNVAEQYIWIDPFK